MFSVGSPSTGLGVWHNCCKDFNLIPFWSLLSPLQSPELKDWWWLDCDQTAADFPGDEAEGSFLAGRISCASVEMIAHGPFSGQNSPLMMVGVGCSWEGTPPQHHPALTSLVTALALEVAHLLLSACCACALGEAAHRCTSQSRVAASTEPISGKSALSVGQKMQCKHTEMLVGRGVSLWQSGYGLRLLHLGATFSSRAW